MNDFASFVNKIIGLINPAVAVLGALALAIFMYGIVRYVYAAGDSGAKTDGRAMMLWGGLALFILVCLWGIVALFSNSFFSSTSVQYYSGGSAPVSSSPNIVWDDPVSGNSSDSQSIEKEYLPPPGGFMVPSEWDESMRSAYIREECTSGSARQIGLTGGGSEPSYVYYACQ